MKRKVSIVIMSLSVLALMAPASVGAAIIPAETVVVGTDPQGDWGGGGNAALVGHALGQDLVGASIGMPNAGTVQFRINVTFLPTVPAPASVGGVPEATRYTWDMLVDGKFVELDGKWSNYSRGACDPTSGQCNPAGGKLPRNPGPQPFIVRGDCVANEQNVTVCRELGIVSADFDPATGSITVAVPLGLLGAVECSRIGAGPNLFGGSISATPAAFVSSTAAPLDFLTINKAFRVPTDDPEGCPS